SCVSLKSNAFYDRPAAKGLIVDINSQSSGAFARIVINYARIRKNEHGIRDPYYVIIMDTLASVDSFSVHHDTVLT
ncbi:hypothetical protein, partial [Salmonella enterica]|uniref:hypothetical protein n=1 Tax=Salmonella enterica TaxID=28901 RepID=UPI003CEF07BC